MKDTAKEFLIKNLSLWAMASLTLGLAPFIPHPHIWKQIVNISKGGGMMTGMDWFDLLLHGTPWVLLIVTLILKLTDKKAVAKK
jgi:hypothetical protein|tara:strand:- start:18047 stop:18298 length:252 start_codon:yes stop_codon:yes gene_type:complete